MAGWWSPNALEKAVAELAPVIQATFAKTRAEAKREIFEYIEVFYQRERLHSANNYFSRVDYEIRYKSA